MSACSGTDRAGATTQFTYVDGPNDPEHYLDEILDPFGRTAATTTYDSAGRVETVTDADGKTITYTYDGDNKVQTITISTSQLPAGLWHATPASSCWTMSPHDCFQGGSRETRTHNGVTRTCFQDRPLIATNRAATG